MVKRIFVFLLVFALIFSFNTTLFAHENELHTTTASDAQKLKIKGEDVEIISTTEAYISVPSSSNPTSETKGVSALATNIVHFTYNLCKSNTTQEVWGECTWTSYTGTAPSSVGVTIKLNKYTSRTASAVVANQKSFSNISMGTKYVTDRKSTLDTGTSYWNTTLTATAVVSGASNTETFTNNPLVLLNKAAVQYPSYTDPLSMKVMSEPATNLTKVSNPLPVLTTTQRNAYKAWYESTYCNGVVQDWSNVQVHHIKPRIYGGTHDYSNLIPLRTTFHSTVTTWWVNYSINTNYDGCE